MDTSLDNVPDSASTEDAAHAYFTKCIEITSALFTSKRSTPPRKTKLVLKILNDINSINIALFHIKEGSPIPNKITNREIFRDQDMTLENLERIKTIARVELNSKSRKRAALARRLHTNRRSDHFNNGRLGPFLCSALSKFTTFRGIESIYNTVTGAITSTPDEVKDLATTRISNTFYTQRIPEPAYVHSDTDDSAWHLMPQWYKETFSNIKTRHINHRLRTSMRTVTPSELRAALERLGKNKSGGPSQLTAEMLIYSSPAAQAKFLLPFVNMCILNRDTPMFTKKFNVWCIEKTKGVGPILHPTNKLDVRPISLFEVSFKLVETVLATRINEALAPQLNPAQHAFNAIRSVVDAIVTYTLVMEDAKQHKKEIHISNNDCTQAYDAVPPWAMRAVYRYHGFPPELITMLMNMDTNMKGRVLTAHGAGTEWTKTCGLGQGSVLAPLKWNLFLDPLLHRLDKTKDPYIIGSGPFAKELRVLAFADDTTIFASTHSGYLTRMAMAGEYFGIFGVNFSPQKTHYTYANTGGRHYASAPITVRKPDGSTQIQPSSVTSPHKPLRYLGAWLSPTMNWLPAKRKLRDEVTKITTILSHKNMTPGEFKYTIQSVLHSKLRYYLSIVPLLDTELDAIDARVACIMKKRMRMASSCSSPLLFLPDSEFGSELASIKDTRATMIMELMHTLLNDDHSMVGSILRIRLRSLRDSLGWAKNPLESPHLIPQSHWNTHWCARAGILLHRHKATISDTHGVLTRSGGRFRDISLHTLLSSSSFSSARASLKKHGLYWLGQITNPRGTKLSSRSMSGKHDNTKWWKTLQASITTNDGTLASPISPTVSPFTPLSPTHPPGTVTTSYTLDADTNEWTHKYYKVTDSHMSNGRESCYVTQLYPCTSKLHSIRQNNKRARDTRSYTTQAQVLSTRGTPYYKGDNHTEEFADSLHPVTCTWSKATPFKRYPLDIGIIHTSCSIHTTRDIITGTTKPEDLEHIARTVMDRHDPITGEYTPPPSIHNNRCHLCSHSQAEMKCTSPLCENHVHKRCTDESSWTCESCTPDRSHVSPLSPSQLDKLERRAESNVIYSASDGSVTSAGTTSASSSFGLVIDRSHTNIRRSGKISIKIGEESSLRVELEALIHAYFIIPPHIQTIHAADNETAIDIHDTLASSGLPQQRSLVKLPYHSTIARLYNAMQTRGKFLDVRHTLSHLEHRVSPDPDLNERRKSLAAADSEADRFFFREDSLLIGRNSTTY